jgi:phosphoglycolate phosphatase
VETFGSAGATAGFDYSGKTDPQIVRELMRGRGFDDGVIDARLPLALERYRARLAEWIRPRDVRSKPGIGPLLEALETQPRVALGLLTGNLEPCARLKLEPVGANRFFPFGAFGSDHEDRYRLPELALARALAATGIAFQGADTVIVGDSVHDVLCGRSIGVRAVAVATGRTPAERLGAAGADVVVSDFGDTRAALRAILG